MFIVPVSVFYRLVFLQWTWADKHWKSTYFNHSQFEKLEQRMEKKQCRPFVPYWCTVNSLPDPSVLIGKSQIAITTFSSLRPFQPLWPLLLLPPVLWKALRMIRRRGFWTKCSNEKCAASVLGTTMPVPHFHSMQIFNWCTWTSKRLKTASIQCVHLRWSLSMLVGDR